MNIKKSISRFYLFLSLAAMAYYAVCVIYAWYGVSWLWIWPAFAGFCMLRHGMLQLEYKGKLHFPYFLRMLYRMVIIICLCFFCIIERGIIRDMNTVPETGLDYIIVLGAAVRGDEPTTPLLLRIDTACEYLTSNPRSWAIASGGTGTGESISEAECIRSYLGKMGIKSHRIIIEDSSTSTEENLINSFAIINDSKIRVGIVTNSFHIHRALMIANRLGYKNVCGIPAPTLMPLGIHYVVREFFAVSEIWIKEILNF